MTLGEKLKEARKQAGLSQEQLAEQLIISRSAIAKWESDLGIPDIENLRALAEHLNISMESLLDDPKACKRPVSLPPQSPNPIAGSPAPTAPFGKNWAAKAVSKPITAAPPAAPSPAAVKART
jgi:transcriptional regulator with XRE-family HTH domain